MTKKHNLDRGRNLRMEALEERALLCAFLTDNTGSIAYFSLQTSEQEQSEVILPESFEADAETGTETRTVEVLSNFQETTQLLNNSQTSKKEVEDSFTYSPAYKQVEQTYTFSNGSYTTLYGLNQVDLSKLSLTNGSFIEWDSNLDTEKSTGTSAYCWAGTFANMAYYSGWAQASGSSEFSNSDELFEYLVEHFTAKGLDVRQTFMWFATGTNDVIGKSGYAQPKAGTTGGNFFPDITCDSIRNIYVRYYNPDSTTTPVTYRKSIFDAIEQNYGQDRCIALSLTVPGGTGHTVACWGVVRDKNDNVIGVLITDTDDDKYKGSEASDYLRYYTVQWDETAGMWKFTNYFSRSDVQISAFFTMKNYPGVYLTASGSVQTGLSFKVGELEDQTFDLTFQNSSSVNCNRIKVELSLTNSSNTLYTTETIFDIEKNGKWTWNVTEDLAKQMKSVGTYYLRWKITNGDGTEYYHESTVYVKSNNPDSPKWITEKCGYSDKDSSITLVWESVSDADSYTLKYNYSVNGEKQTPVEKNIKETSYTLEGVPLDASYTFTIQTVDSDGAVSSDSTEKTICTKLSAPTLTVTSTTGSEMTATATKDPITGITYKYTFAYKTKNSETWTEMKSQTDPVCTIPCEPGTYEVRVKVADSSNMYDTSDYSASVECEVKVPVPTITPGWATGIARCMIGIEKEEDSQAKLDYDKFGESYYDIDGNGEVDVLTDGLLLRRYADEYYKKEGWTSGAVGVGAERATDEAIKAYIDEYFFMESKNDA